MTQRVVDYELTEAYSMVELTEGTTERLAQGWQPLGGPVIDFDLDWKGDGTGDYEQCLGRTYYQAWVKYE